MKQLLIVIVTLKNETQNHCSFLDIIQLEPAASSVAPFFIHNSDSDVATTDSPTTLLETTTKNDVIFLSLKPEELEEESTELSTTSTDDFLHDDFSLHEHDETTNAGGNLIT